MYGRNIVALPGNQAETEKTNISLQHLEEPVYSTIQRIRYTDPRIGFSLRSDNLLLLLSDYVPIPFWGTLFYCGNTKTEIILEL